MSEGLALGVGVLAHSCPAFLIAVLFRHGKGNLAGAHRLSILRLALSSQKHGLIFPSVAHSMRPWASLRKEGMPMVRLLRAVLVNTVGRLLADLLKRLFD